jgi:glutamine synthetase
MISDCLLLGGNACHAHISVHPTSGAHPGPSNSDPNLNKLEASFLAGVLAHLPALLALTLPFPASYSRMLDGIFAGGTWVSWGTDNREVPIRLANAASPSSRNFEYKLLDGTANPYLALAGILGAGVKGILDGAHLTLKDCTGPSAAQRGEAGRKELGVTQRLPLKWEEARGLFRQSVVLKNILGDSVVEKYLSVNEVGGNFIDIIDACSADGMCFL